jgi:hypothetical protein
MPVSCNAPGSAWPTPQGRYRKPPVRLKECHPRPWLALYSEELERRLNGRTIASLKVDRLNMIENLGNIGEFVAAIATLITLAYLAIQIRQNTKAVKATTFMESQHFFASLHDQLAHDPALLETALNAFDPQRKLEDFSQTEQFQLGMLGRSVMQRTEAQFYLHKSGFLEDEFWEMRRSWMRGWFEMPVWKEWWSTERDQGTVSPSFIRSIESAKPASLNAAGLDVFKG